MSWDGQRIESLPKSIHANLSARVCLAHEAEDTK